MLAIIGVLAAVVVTALNAVEGQGTGSACMANLRQVVVAQETYFAENNAYADVDTLVSAGLLGKAPPTGDYAISADATTGEVSVDPPECTDP